MRPCGRVWGHEAADGVFEGLARSQNRQFASGGPQLRLRALATRLLTPLVRCDESSSGMRGDQSHRQTEADGTVRAALERFGLVHVHKKSDEVTSQDRG